MRSVDEPAKLVVGAQMWVDLGEVSDPVPVVARRWAVLQLYGLVLETGRQPDRGRAKTADVVDAVQQTLQVAALVEALVRRIETVLGRTALDAAGVVRGRAVLEPIGHHEVERLVGDRSSQRMLADERAACWSRTRGANRCTRSCGGHDGSQQNDKNATQEHAASTVRRMMVWPAQRIHALEESQRSDWACRHEMDCERQQIARRQSPAEW